MCSPGPRQPPSTTPAPAHCEEEAAGNNRGRVGRHRSPGSGSLRKLPTPSSVTALRLSPARLFRRFQTMGRLHDGERAGTWPSSKNLTALASPYVRKRHRRAKPLFLLRRSEVQAVVPEGFGRPLGVGVAPFETRPRRSASTATLRPPSPTDNAKYRGQLRKMAAKWNVSCLMCCLRCIMKYNWTPSSLLLFPRRELALDRRRLRKPR